MSLSSANSFHFQNPGSSSGITVLNAVMADFSYGKHAHEELAIGVTTAGVQEFSCKGRYFSSLPGDIILFNPEDVHNGSPGGGDVLKYTMLYFDPGKLYPLVGCASNELMTKCRIPQTHFRDAALRSTLLGLSRHAGQLANSPLEQEHELYAVAVHIAKMLGRFHPDGWTNKKDALLLRVRDYIHANIEADISIDELSHVTTMSKYHLIRLFRSQFGLTPHQYILNHRINKVREALKNGVSATSVAHEFGFFDSSHLNRHFKRAYGITPKQYQLQVQR
ncbi:AraC family transcriptional regulator [Pelobacter seleniigenes]|uniref:AraC family transcriptional regulator n=1 Tax=Pelobacter seleniigenes TaxID=407188 RepID=UPI000690FB5B|nr:AraC family transcriptional regulator [Pelobacter seleniigenes]